MTFSRVELLARLQEVLSECAAGRISESAYATFHAAINSSQSAQSSEREYVRQQVQNLSAESHLYALAVEQSAVKDIPRSLHKALQLPTVAYGSTLCGKKLAP